MKVTRLDGALLDFWVAKSENLKLLPNQPEEGGMVDHGSGYWHPSFFRPSSDWSQGGPIIANDWYNIEDALIEWFGSGWPFIKAINDDPLKWMLRAYVKTKFGDEVEDDVGHFMPSMHVEKEFQPSAGSGGWPSWFSRERRRQSDKAY